ncbi:UbiA prenyltransferase [Tricholoma matsutake]|nr:UbiA prenyltransferase [Tricholoma matsutake 945]
MGRSASTETTFLLVHKSALCLTSITVSVRPYLELIRLEKPTGTILMFWPFAWGLTMAAFTANLSLRSYLIHLLKWLVGAFILRSSACTINDIFDRDMDACIERTKNRPLASGRLSVFAATVFLLIQYCIGILFFYLTMDDLAVFSSSASTSRFAIYPLLKRITHWPQAWLGFAMNFGVITSWVSIIGSLHNIPLLYAAMAGCWCWTMLYDTIYACQDMNDDVKVGVRSTAILFGSWIRPLLMTCGFTFVAMLAVAGYLNGQSNVYFILTVGGTAAHVVWQFMTVDLEAPHSCWRNFNRNGYLGLIIWGGLLIDYLLKIIALQCPA